MRKKLGDVRLLAEANYMVGLTLCNTKQTEAMSYLQTALEILSTSGLHGVEDIVKELGERIVEIQDELKGEVKTEEPRDTIKQGPVSESNCVHDFGVLGGSRKRKTPDSDVLDEKVSKKFKETN
eukprot:TRINITY_DN2850_c0_g1_i4.p1 TRINITY_DN2850_c0_g1~~TRINITY_DN2850_c0_g1_i4.p1  ORF type:complete len:124 (+),score=34.53 TRINITY_DN2850_c0_g1_i4:446-817(+)